MATPIPTVAPAPAAAAAIQSTSPPVPPAPPAPPAPALNTPSVLESGVPTPNPDRLRFLKALIPKLNNVPPFRTYLRRDGPDILLQALCFAAAMCLYELVPPLMPRYVPYYPGIENTSWGLKHSRPWIPEYITTIHSAVISFAIPALVIATVGLWGTKSFEDINAAILTLGAALALSTLFISVIKVTVGGLRPHFLTVCNPVMPETIPGPPLTNSILFFTPNQLCSESSKAVREAQMSFPSGHANAAFAGFGVLALYLNARFKIFGWGRLRDLRSGAGPVDLANGGLPTTALDAKGPPANVVQTTTAGPVASGGLFLGGVGRRTPFWKLVAFVLPLLVAAVLALSKLRDMWHHPVDVVVGAMIGMLFAIMAYRLRHRSVWDARDNHVPLGHGSGGDKVAKDA